MREGRVRKKAGSCSEAGLFTERVTSNLEVHGFAQQVAVVSAEEKRIGSEQTCQSSCWPGVSHGLANQTSCQAENCEGFIR